MARRLEVVHNSQSPVGPRQIGGESPFVGRDLEIALLTEALARAAQGKGGTVFLTGQRGIGKTRLAHEALRLAKGMGFRALEGRAYPLGVRVSYAPILDAFGPLLRGIDHPLLTELVKGLPDLGCLFSDLGLPRSEPLSDPELQKTRLFEAVARLLERLARQTPLVLFMDDLHWTDPVSLDLLHYLARSLSGLRVLLLVAYSSDAFDSSPNVRQMVDWLLRTGLAQEIVVPRLKAEAVGKLVQNMLKEAASGQLLTLLEARAGGTPLFIQEIIGTFVDSGTLSYTDQGWVPDSPGANAVPPSVRRLILERLDRLTPTERQVLDLIAVMGDPTSFTLLQNASCLAEDVFLDVLVSLKTRGLVVEGFDRSDLMYSIAHPLIQEVAYAELPEVKRRRTHVAAIRAFELFRPGDSSRLARHYRGAGPDADPGRALAVLLSAGERARALYANDEAAQHYSAALGIVREGGMVADFGDSSSQKEPFLPWLLERLGEAWERIGEAASIAVLNEALIERDRTDPNAEGRPAIARLHCQLALAELDRGHADLAQAHVRDGLRALANCEPCPELADLHYARFHILNRLGDTAGVAETVEVLLSLARQLASPMAEAKANLAVCSFRLRQNDVAQAREYALQALKIGGTSPEGEDLAVCCRAHTALASIGLRMGDHRLMRYHAECGLIKARRLGAPDSEALYRFFVAFSYFMDGSWEESLRWNMGAVVLARRVGHPRGLAYALALRAIVFAMQGDLAKSETCIAEARTTLGNRLGEGLADKYAVSIVDVAETALRLEREPADIVQGIESVLVRPSAAGGTSTGLVQLFMPIGLMVLAEAQVAAGQPERALETAGELVKLSITDSPYLKALAHRAEGIARRGLGQREASAACAAQAHREFAALEMPFEAARSMLEQATAAARTHPELAASLAKEVLVVFDRLGAQSYFDRSRKLLRELGVPLPVTRQSSSRKGILSPREIEIACLVAEGITTAEVTVRLSLSRRTVETHLQHIYRRLGIGSRAALTRYVCETGLLSTTRKNT